MNFLFPDWFSADYGKKYGVFVPSGMLAIEAALYLLRIPYGANVLIPSNACWKIAYAIQRVGLNPLFLDPGSDIVVQARMLKEFDFKDVSVYIAVHHLGLPTNVLETRRILPRHISIIEDASQAWRIKSCGETIGTWSDIVVTSFGSSKPISFGFGGAVFFNNAEMISQFDLSRQAQFFQKDGSVPYTLPIPANNILVQAYMAADSQLKERIQFVRIIQQAIASSERLGLWVKARGDYPTWGRVPILFNTCSDMNSFINVAKDIGMTYQLPHENNLHEIPFIRGKYISISAEIHRNPYILLYPNHQTKQNLRLDLLGNIG